MRPLLVILLLVPIALLTACASTSRQFRSSAIEYLYPSGKEAEPSRDITLRLPARVAIAFVPVAWGSSEHDVLTESLKQEILEQIAAGFRGRDTIGDIRVIPSTYVKPGGGYEDLDRIAAAFGVDLAVLISYNHAQFSDSGPASLAYWTIIGAYVVKGEKQETRTVIDAAVIDIASRALLFSATGEGRGSGSATLASMQRELREQSEKAFRSAADDLVAKLDIALTEFQAQAKTGTVRGPGTPAIGITSTASPGAAGGGAAGAGELLLAALVAGAGLAARRRRRS